MATRRYNPRRAKSLHSFTISEAAELYGVHRNTVRHWLAEGLNSVDARKPVLIHGTALNSFHAARRASSKQKCGPGELYCLRCRAPRRPALNMADYTPLTSSMGALVAICTECTGVMTQRVNAARLKVFMAEIEVTIKSAPEPIKGSAYCLSNCHFETRTIDMELNAANERLKHRYVAYLRGARQLGEHSIDQILAALNRFEEYTRRRGFKDFRVEQATGFKKHLASLNTQSGNRRLSKATITSTLHAMRDFIIWLSEQRGFRGRMVRTDADYFKPSRRDDAIARAPRQMPIATVEQIRVMVAAMPATTAIERRNRALVAITIVTGARDNATASVRLKHLDLDDCQLFQDARDMRTKFGKTFPTWFFPVGDDFVAILADWKRELEQVHGFGVDDPLFPQTEIAFGSGGEVLPPRLKRACWANADPIRKVFKDACAAARLPDFKPHSFRHTLAQLGSHLCTTPAEYKAWSQNLGHDGAMVTLTSYGTLPGYSQRELILGIGKRAKAA